MNTSDRSVALLDQALRRRFHFVGLFPDQEPIKGLLRRYLKKWYGERMSWVADVLENANAKLDRNVAIGPSHFMRRDLDHETVGRIWRHSVMPTIEEHYLGQDERIAEFTLEALRPATNPDGDVAATS
jgi:5-methylcytosine-specific restriction protein B